MSIDIQRIKYKFRNGDTAVVREKAMDAKILDHVPVVKKNGFSSLDPPTKCINCGQLFEIRGNHLYAWRHGGLLFCNEWCAEGMEDRDVQE